MTGGPLADLVADAVRVAATEGAIPTHEVPQVELERPRRAEHGDWATNIALQVASGKGNPRAVAEEIAARVRTSELLDKVEVAGPGFINLHLAPRWFHEVVRRAAADSRYGQSDAGATRRVNVEFVSANPTGPVNVVSGRHAAVGDAIANLLEATGHEVIREFFVNDAGRQIRLLGQSVAARYLEHLGREVSFPEEGYQGAYVSDLAAVIAARQDGIRFAEMDEEARVSALGAVALDHFLGEMKASLERFGTTYDVWFSERDMHARGDIAASIQRLTAAGYTEVREGATWFLSERLGDDKDRVLVRRNGEPTYLAADAAYLVDKFERGFDHLIYLWGSDHHGTVSRMLALADALGYDRSNVEIRLVQVVTLARGGEAVKASKRAGILVPLDELVGEVGPDAARYTFLTRSMEAPLDFDIELAKEQAPENPVYYVQYAHARISSILRRAASEGYDVDLAASLERVVHPSEKALMRRLDAWPETVSAAAEARAPQKVCRFVEGLAADFSAFYRDCRVLSEDGELTAARLLLCAATRRVIASALGLVGVGAPESM